MCPFIPIDPYQRIHVTSAHGDLGTVTLVISAQWPLPTFFTQGPEWQQLILQSIRLIYSNNKIIIIRAVNLGGHFLQFKLQMLKKLFTAGN